jgi:glycosyltransferase involved in cell wall biosynthesis
MFADLRLIQSLRIQARQEVENASAYDRILVNSRYSRESVLRAYGLNAKVCYLGVDTDVFRTNGTGREYYVLGVGSFTPQKNITFLIEAVAGMRRPKPRVVWIGNVASQAYLAELRALALANGVEFDPLLMVGDKELVRHLNTAMLMVYAPRLEPFGLAPLEAAACELPTLAVAEAGVRESIVNRETGVLVDADIDQYANALDDLLANPDGLGAFGRKARIRIEQEWTLDRAVERLEDHLHACAKGQR